MAGIISVRDLTKVYRGPLGKALRALDSVSLEIEPGEAFGLLGPNGAGKTTLVKLLLGMSRPTSGEASLCGFPPTEVESRRDVGYLPEGHRFPGYLTARQTLELFGRASGIRTADLTARAMPLLERVGIARWADVRVSKFSKGMTQRLGLAAALVHKPKLLLLDEPTDGIDPVGRREVRDLLEDVRREGTTIFLNSHLLSEVEKVCDRVAILRSGRVAAIGTIDELTRPGVERWKIGAEGVAPELRARLFAMRGVSAVNGHFELEGTLDEANGVVDLVRGAGARVTELVRTRRALEDVFIELVRPADNEPEARP